MNVFDYIEKELDRIEVGYTSYDGTKITLTMDEVRELIRNLRKKYQPDEDVIYRQAAIDAIDKYSVWVTYTQGDLQKDEAEFVENIIKQTKKAIQSMLIEDLPSAQSIQTASNYLQSLPTSPLLVGKMPSAHPEQRWISCSERLPDNDTYVLISKNPHPLTGEKWCVTIAARFADGRSREIQWRDIGFGRLRDVEVIAWMPLPEPYKEECKE